MFTPIYVDKNHSRITSSSWIFFCQIVLSESPLGCCWVEIIFWFFHFYYFSSLTCTRTIVLYISFASSNIIPWCQDIFDMILYRTRFITSSRRYTFRVSFYIRTVHLRSSYVVRCYSVIVDGSRNKPFHAIPTWCGVY